MSSLTNQLLVERAQREKIKIPILLSGVSGSGKTLSALFLAYGIVSEMYPEALADDLWAKVGVIDTEHRRSSLYANIEKEGVQVDSFSVVYLEEPFSVDRYELAFSALLQAKCEVIIIDSTSHQWEGAGGTLDTVDKLGGRFADWNKVKPLEERFKALAISSQVHVISTSRVKQDYVVEPNDKGKMAPRKVGLKGIQKDNLEYEYAVSFRIEQGAMAYPMKDNSGIFDQPKQLGVEDGRKLYKWSELGIDVAKAERERNLKEEKERLILLQELQALSKSDVLIAQRLQKAAIYFRLPLEQFDYATMTQTYKQLMGGN